MLAVRRSGVKHVAHQVDLTALPRGSLKVPSNRIHQPAVVVGYHQIDPCQPPLLQPCENLRPARLRLAVADHQPQDLSVALGIHPYGQYGALGDHAPAFADLELQGIHDHKRVRYRLQRTLVPLIDPVPFRLPFRCLIFTNRLSNSHPLSAEKPSTSPALPEPPDVFGDELRLLQASGGRLHPHGQGVTGCSVADTDHPSLRIEDSYPLALMHLLGVADERHARDLAKPVYVPLPAARPLVRLVLEMFLFLR